MNEPKRDPLYILLILVAVAAFGVFGWWDPAHRWVSWVLGIALLAVSIVADSYWRSKASNAPYVGRFIRRLAPSVRLQLAIAALVALFVAALFADHAEIFYAGQAAVLLLGLRDTELRATVVDTACRMLPFLEPGVRFRARQEQYRAIAENLNQTLDAFGQPALDEEELDVIAKTVPGSQEMFVADCCRAFADRCDLDPVVLELLYRGSRGDKTRDLWAQAKRLDSLDAAKAERLARAKAKRLARAKAKRGGSPSAPGRKFRRKLKSWLNPVESPPVKRLEQLAEILEKSGDTLSKFDEKDDTIASINWLFDHLDEFRLERNDLRVQSEMEFLVSLWRHVNSYTDFLNEHIPGGTRTFDPKDLWKYADRSSEEDALIEVSKDWFADWAKNVSRTIGRRRAHGRIGPTPHPTTITGRLAAPIGRTPASVRRTIWRKRAPASITRTNLGKRTVQSSRARPRLLSSSESDSLAMVVLGVFSAATPREFPLEQGLYLNVANDETALRMLFAHLWARSKSPVPVHFELDPLTDWKRREQDAIDVLSKAICHALREDLRDDLRKGRWPTGLPMSHVSVQVEAYLEKLELVKKKQASGDWRGDIRKMLRRTGRSPESQLDDQALVAEAESALRELLPERIRPPPEEPVTIKDACKLDKVVAALELHPETPPVDKHEPIDLDSEIAAIKDMLWAEAGTPVYMITFDQHRGRSALLIDCLKQKYGFLNYTVYSRIGELERGKSFEDFRLEFGKDLERLFEYVLQPEVKNLTDLADVIDADPKDLQKLENAIRQDSPPNATNWRQVEISLQQISRQHRHDLHLEVAGSLQEKLPSSVDLAQIFRIHPSSEAFLQASARARYGATRRTAAMRRVM